MGHLQKQYNGYCLVSESELQVGNQDSILLFGCTAQQQLRDFSKLISCQLFNENGDVEYLIHDILKKMDDFQGLIRKNTFFSIGKTDKKRSVLIKKYGEILVSIDKMEIALKLQEAQIVKELKLYEELSKNIVDVLSNLENTILYGKKVINQQSNVCDSKETENWYERLEKKIQDLEISHTVALQCQAQMELMLENNTKLVDKILGAVSGTIPIWRNQISILLGIERMSRNMMIQSKLAEITQSLASRSKADKNNNEVSVEKLLQTNESLKKVIDEIDSVEKNNDDIRLEFSNLLG